MTILAYTVKLTIAAGAKVMSIRQVEDFYLQANLATCLAPSEA